MNLTKPSQDRDREKDHGLIHSMRPCIKKTTDHHLSQLQIYCFSTTENIEKKEAI